MSTRWVVGGAWLNPAGFTLLEVVVALALFSLILGISGLALASLRAPMSADTTQQLVAARASSIRTGRSVSVTVTSPDTGKYNAPRTTHILFLPDGRAVGNGVDQLTGAPIDFR
jgi:prepilin-type N-terminal cleavage/methylation domain-containing protein